MKTLMSQKEGGKKRGGQKETELIKKKIKRMGQNVGLKQIKPKRKPEIT